MYLTGFWARYVLPVICQSSRKLRLTLLSTLPQSRWSIMRSWHCNIFNKEPEPEPEPYFTVPETARYMRTSISRAIQRSFSSSKTTSILQLVKYYFHIQLSTLIHPAHTPFPEPPRMHSSQIKGGVRRRRRIKHQRKEYFLLHPQQPHRRDQSLRMKQRPGRR